MLKHNQIYIKPVGGLCNRMRAIDSCISLASEYNKQVIVVWGRDPFLNCRFSDLFQQPANYDVLEEKEFFGRKSVFPYLPGSRPVSSLKSSLYQITRSALGIKKEIWFEDLDHALIPLREIVEKEQIKDMKSYEMKALTYLAPFASMLQENGNSFICSAWRLCPDQHYRTQFVPTDLLMNKISQITNQFNYTTGIHIRRSDHNLSIQHSGLSKFKAAIDSILMANNKSTFFLATDCSQTEQELKAIYQGRIITYQKQSYNRNATIGIQDALVDLFCLSATDKVLGSYFSSFSQVAAEISGIEEQTIL